MNKILILDDDSSILSEVSKIVDGIHFIPLPCKDVDQAKLSLTENEGQIAFAIVDLYLLGARGESLSNDFIQMYLEPKSIPYGRFTSAPTLVPENRRGKWILDKREFYTDPMLLVEKLIQTLNRSSDY